MTDRLESLASRSVKGSYIKLGIDNLKTRENKLYQLLDHKKLPKEGYDDNFIQYAIETFSAMDSNNFSSNCGVGEREGRVYSSLVRHRHYGLSHGIGRSGDIAEVQPKAAGSSLIYTLTNDLIHHAIQLAGISSMKKCLVIPMATGVSISLCLSTLKSKSKNPQQMKYVIWPRIDQKSCFKSISAANCIPLVVENVMKPYPGDTKVINSRNGKSNNHDNNNSTSNENSISEQSELSPSSSVPQQQSVMETDVDQIEELLKLHRENILCILSTTSCFAPRQPDAISAISVLCKQYNVSHVINNAYGLQCKYICKQINRACLLGRVDAVIQSTDKNFMVPVGGAIITSPSVDVIDMISAHYPGRASISPILDLFITLLSMGQTGYTTLLTERERLFQVLKQGVQVIAHKYGEETVVSPYNSISIAVTLRHLDIAYTISSTTNSVSSTNISAVIQDSNIAAMNTSASVDNIADDQMISILEIDSQDKNKASDINTAVSSNNNHAGNDTTRDVTTATATTQLPSSSPSSVPSATKTTISTPNLTHHHTGPTFFGAMLFQRQVSGCRVIAKSSTSTSSTKTTTVINDILFKNWGAHTNTIDCSYFTTACAIGMTQDDVETFLVKLEKCFQKTYQR